MRKQNGKVVDSLDMASGSVSVELAGKRDIELEIEKSRLEFRTWVFRAALFIVFFFYTIFAFLLLHPEHLTPLIKYTPYALCLVIFAGSIPTVLFIVLLLSTFRARKQESNGIDEQNLFDNVSKLASVARLFK
ncbi:hypothetical protein [Maridesulfovibrio sp.]|uniref:hypothetical protein n=1 Tax=Maridesulfovibrio sp. TaxID=2795000 RepID=UPI002A18A23F|nr:hypothetical protein [Maridesulfovibrio sp.]